MGFVLALLSFPSSAQQAESPPGTHETVIAGDYFGAGGNLTPGTAVEGDAFIAGGQVFLQTPVAGDAVISGGSVSISAAVGDDLYATGGSVLLESVVNGNARLAGGDVEIGRQARVAGKATIAGRTVHVLGKVGRQLAIFGDKVTLDGDVSGNVTVAARRLTVGPNARINGKLTFRGPVPAEVDAGAVIGGGISHLDFDFDREVLPFPYTMSWVAAIAFTVGLLLIGALAIVMAPLATSKVGLLGRARPFTCLGLGFATIFCTPVVALVLMLTVVGIPFAIVLLMSWPVMLIFGYLAGVMAVTDAIAGSTRKKLSGNGLRIFLLALGLGGMLAFCWLPLIGPIVGLLLMVAGVGAMTFHAFGGRPIPRERKREEEETVLSRREPTFRI